MRNQPWFRAFASLLALWFPLIAGEPGLLHPCPTHGSGAAVIASFAGHPAGHSSHVAVRHGEHATNSQHTNSHNGAPSHDHHNCTCITGCCASLSATTAPSTPTIDVAVLDIDTAAAVSNAPAIARAAAEFARPYTTGPPRA